MTFPSFPLQIGMNEKGMFLQLHGFIAHRDSIGGHGGDAVEKEGDEEEESENEDDNPLNNPEVQSGILDTVGILWATSALRLSQPQNIKYLEALRTKISKNFQHFFRYFKVGSITFFRFLSTVKPAHCETTLDKNRD